MDRNGCICVFAKPPRAGDAKTRLIPLVGKDGAAALAEAFLLDTWAAVCDLPWAKAIIASTGTLPLPLIQQPREVWLQGEGDLGARLERIFTRALEGSSFALALGADSPGLPASRLERARLALAKADAVIGPCDDGGFYLLGLRRCPPGLLAGISWSESNTFALTLAKLEAAGLRVHVLEPWFDVDQPRDLARLRGLLALGDLYAPKTTEVLNRLFAIKKEAAPPRISVIIPVLNEREHLPRVLDALRGKKWVHEVVVVDGGSSDGTWEWLQRQNCASALSAPRGKGIQLNAGARAASGDVLLFLHGDCVLPADAGQQICRIFKEQDVAGGCFLVQFGESPVRSLRLVAAGINLRTRLTRTATGEQAIFARKQAFEEAGGCADWPLFEDVDLVRRIKRRGRFAVLRSRVTVSPRRHLSHGVFKTVLLAYGLRLAFWAGASPFALKRWFDDVRPHLGPMRMPHQLVPRRRKLPMPPILVFDVNETLLDLSALNPVFEKSFGSPAVRTEWFQELLKLAFVTTITVTYSDFSAIGRAALEIVETRHRRPLPEEQRQQILQTMRRLPAHADVNDGLKRLRQAGLRLVALTNSALEAAETQLSSAGIRHYFESVFSADSAHRLKPAREPYLMVEGKLGVAPDSLLMVAAHSWDLAGAMSLGWKAAFIARPGQVLDALTPKPDFVAPDLRVLAQQILESQGRAS